MLKPAMWKDNDKLEKISDRCRDFIECFYLSAN